MYYDKLILKGYKVQPKFLGCNAGFSIRQFSNWKEFSHSLKRVMREYSENDSYGYMVSCSDGYYYLYRIDLRGDYDSVAYCHGDGWVMDFDPSEIITIGVWDNRTESWKDCDKFHLINANDITPKRIPINGYNQYTKPIEIEGLSIYERHFIEGDFSDRDKFNSWKFFKLIQRICNPLENFALCERDKRKKDVIKYYYKFSCINFIKLLGEMYDVPSLSRYAS